MFCTHCSAPLQDKDIYCPKCGQPVRHRGEQPQRSQVVNEPTTESYATYYENVEKEEKRVGVFTFVKVALVALLGVFLVLFGFCGVFIIRGENPVDKIKGIFAPSEKVEETVVVIPSPTDSTTSTFFEEVPPDNEPSDTQTTTTTTTTVTTTTTTKPTTTAAPVGDLIRETAVGKWTADISALEIGVAGINVKTILLDIDKNGKADVTVKVGFFKKSTTGSFVVKDDGRTLLSIVNPLNDETLYIEGKSKVVNDNMIVFTTSDNHQITLDRVK